MAVMLRAGPSPGAPGRLGGCSVSVGHLVNHLVVAAQPVSVEVPGRHGSLHGAARLSPVGAVPEPAPHSKLPDVAERSSHPACVVDHPEAAHPGGVNDHPTPVQHDEVAGHGGVAALGVTEAHLGGALQATAGELVDQRGLPRP